MHPVMRPFHSAWMLSRWMVIMPCWVVNVLFLQCVGVRRTTVGVVAPVGVAIRLTGLSNQVGGSMGCSQWMSLMSRWTWLWYRQISASGITVIRHKGRALTCSSSLDTAPVTGSPLFNAPVCVIRRSQQYLACCVQIVCRRLSSLWRRFHVLGGWLITWLRWDCGVHMVHRVLPDPCRYCRIMTVCCVITVFRIYVNRQFPRGGVSCTIYIRRLI